MNNGISSKDDFRRAAEAERAKRAEDVRLPSGLTAKLVKPTPMELFFMQGSLPQGIAARLDVGATHASPTLTPEDLVALAHQTVDLVRFIFVAPRVPDESKPGQDILMSDIEWALRWARGEVVQLPVASSQLPELGTGNRETATDLAEFPGRASGSTPAPGTSRGDVPLPTQ